MPSSLRRYVLSAIVGFALAAVMVGLGLWFNVAQITHAVAQSDNGVLAVLVLWALVGLIFSAVQFGLSAMDVTDDEDDDGPGGGLRQYQLQPIPVRRDDTRR